MENLKHIMRQRFENRNSAEWLENEKTAMEDLVGKVINLSILNPSAFENQAWEIMAVKSSVSKYTLFKLLRNNEIILQAAAVLILLSNASENCFPLAHMSIMYAAKYYGIDFHAITEFDRVPVKEAFHIASCKQLVMVACLGQFDAPPALHSVNKRLRYNDILLEI